MLEAALQLTPDGVAARVGSEGFTLPHSAARTQWEGERRGLLGLRPNDIGIVAPGAAALRGRVFLVEPVGPFAYVDVDLDGWAIKAITDPDSAPAIGEALGLSFDGGRACLFDPDSEARL